MSNMKVHFSAKTPVWGTPQYVFDALHEEFHFDLDVCALPENTKCEKFFSPEDNGLEQSWLQHTVWCNPPYGREIQDWVRRAVFDTALSVKADDTPKTTVVMLLPARTDTKWWHNYVMRYAKEVRFIKGRLKFEGATSSAPFPSCIVVFNSEHSAGGSPVFSSVIFPVPEKKETM